MSVLDESNQVDDRNGQNDVHDEQLRTRKLVVLFFMQSFLEVDFAFDLGKLAVQTCAAAFLKET